MQRSIYDNTISRNITLGKTIIPAPTSRRVSLRRRIARKCDLYGVVALMVSSGMYGIYAVAHCL